MSDFVYLYLRYDGDDGALEQIWSRKTHFWYEIWRKHDGFCKSSLEFVISGRDLVEINTYIAPKAEKRELCFWSREWGQ